MAGVIGVASHSNAGLMSSKDVGTYKAVSGSEIFKNYGVINKINNTSAILTTRMNGTSWSTILLVGTADNGTPFASILRGESTDLKFWYDNEYIYYTKKYGGADSLMPISSNFTIQLNHVGVLPTDVTAFSIS